MIIWKVTCPDGTSCHFGSRASAIAYAGRSGAVETIPLADPIADPQGATFYNESLQDQLVAALRAIVDPDTDPASPMAEYTIRRYRAIARAAIARATGEAE